MGPRDSTVPGSAQHRLHQFRLPPSPAPALLHEEGPWSFQTLFTVGMGNLDEAPGPSSLQGLAMKN